MRFSSLCFSRVDCREERERDDFLESFDCLAGDRWPLLLLAMMNWLLEEELLLPAPEEEEARSAAEVVVVEFVEDSFGPGVRDLTREGDVFFVLCCLSDVVWSPDQGRGSSSFHCCAFSIRRVVHFSLVFCFNSYNSLNFNEFLPKL